MFTNFSSPLLEDLFTPPYGTWLYGPFFYEPIVVVLLSALLLAPLPATLLFAGGCWLFKRLKHLYSIIIIIYSSFTSVSSLPAMIDLLYRIKTARRPRRDWQPWPWSRMYILFLNTTTACFIVLVRCLLRQSQLPDPLVERKTNQPFYP
jgi:hypothetical protein